MHEELAGLLRSYKAIFFEPMWGNNGDDLITEGALKLFNELGLGMVETPEESEAIVINGGGAMTPDWGGIAVLNNYLSSYDKPVFVLPSSFLGDERDFADVVKSLKSRRQPLYLFCRENLSYKRATAFLGGSAEIFLSHDMAMYLTREYLQEKFDIPNVKEAGVLIVERRDAERSTPIQPQRPYKIPFKRIIPLQAKRVVKKAIARCSRGKGTIFQKECMEIIAFSYNELNDEKVICIDISDKGVASFHDFLKLVNSSKIVFTTRLHVAILCHLFRKPCYLNPTGNPYQKNEQVYYQSLKESGFINLIAR